MTVLHTFPTVAKVDSVAVVTEVTNPVLKEIEMTQIVVDNELREKLLQSKAIELVDDTGMILGAFISRRPAFYPPGVVPPISDEERQRLLAEPGIYTTEEVLEHLRSL